MLRLAVLVIATSWLTGCAAEGFETGGLTACPPVAEYSRELQARAAEELAMLHNGFTGNGSIYFVVVRPCK
ncbi:hypothetical protein [Roseovarius sp. ZX-A-9]|uniref:hypothetical protein n=1 Tax=Roseovarius sp. ZX-A-9 TaxID=3014783 RepID=UPI00232D2015|nr:hypothetical protein [Roseovarius sp. ZX-A-9]